MVASSAGRMTEFRSWVEDYQPSEQPIDRAAFHRRAIQRGLARAVLQRDRDASGYAPTVFDHLARQDRADVDRHIERMTNPALRAQLHLQRRGWRVFKAATLSPDATGWIVGARTTPIDDDALIALAKAKGMDVS